MDYIEIDDIKKWLKDNLTGERYEHSLGTADCAKELAKRFGLDSDKAYLAGLIHDCAKCLEKEIMLYNLQKVELCDGEFENCKTHHAPVGMCIAQSEFCIHDEEVLSAIRWHTLGRTNMSEFEKIIFLADKIETRTRENNITQPVYELLNESNGLNKALKLCYKNTIKSLLDRNLKICLTTIEIYNSLL